MVPGQRWYSAIVEDAYVVSDGSDLRLDSTNGFRLRRVGLLQKASARSQQLCFESDAVFHLRFNGGIWPVHAHLTDRGISIHTEAIETPLLSTFQLLSLSPFFVLDENLIRWMSDLNSSFVC
jgi:hypothetical protein